jgi:hypothetical protein
MDKRATPRKAKGGKRGIFRRIDPLSSLLLVFPLFLIYEVGILLVPSGTNGADLITAQILRLLHNRLGLYVALNGGLWALFLGLVLYLRRKHDFDVRLIVPVLAESALYALTMGSLICYVMVDLLHVDPRLLISSGTSHSMMPVLRAGAEGATGIVGVIVIALGAGVHEELIFRVLLVGGFGLFMQRVLGLGRTTALTIAFIVSAVLFSAAHHVIGGEAFRVGAFTYRILCGLIFATIYQLRGVAVAVYTHSLYDIYVMLLR